MKIKRLRWGTYGFRVVIQGKLKALIILYQVTMRIVVFSDFVLHNFYTTTISFLSFSSIVIIIIILKRAFVLFFFSIIATVFVNYLEIYYQLLFNLIYVVEDEILA